MPTRGQSRARPLVLAALAALVLGLAVDAQGAVRASVAGGKLTVTGTSAGERIALRRASGGRLVVDVRDNGSADFSFLRSSFSRIVVNANGGADRLRIDEGNGAFTDTEKTTLNGGGGNDALIGGRFRETLSPGGGNDAVDGNAGADKVALSSGSDALTWNAGDGVDRVNGGGGSDTVTVNGTSGVDTTSVLPAAVPGHVKVGPGPDLLAVETLNLNPRAGVDSTTVGDLPGAGLAAINLNASVGGIGDGAADVLTVNGTAGADVVQVFPSLATVEVNGLASQIVVTGSEAANDRVVVDGFGGNDTLSAGSVSALSQLTLNGADGNDSLSGGNGADTLLGGAGNDTVDGNQGNDVALLGTGNDTAVWDPGDGSDIVEGQADVDTLLFNGSAGAEIFTASSNGGRLLVTRNVGNIVMDLDDVETLTLNALGGIDTATVNDLTPTDITTVNTNLGVAGASDGSADALTVNGTAAVDVMGLSGSAGSVTVARTAYAISVTNAAPATDTLTVNLSGGDDVVSASSLANSSVVLTLNGGADDDVLVGSSGADTLNCDAGTDIADGGAGVDSASGCETTLNVP